VSPRGGDRRRIRGDGVVVDALVEGVCHLGGVTQQQRILADRNISAVTSQGVGGHGDRIPGMESIVADVPVDGLADRFGCAVAQREGCGAFLGVAHPPHFGEVLGPGQIGAQLGEHATARLHRGQLVGIPDQDGLHPGGGGGSEQLTQVVGADHAGLVNHHQRPAVQP
jgi:hypothetical protein